MTTIYAVASGEYSDYGISALFSTEELAQRYIDKCDPDRWSYPRIEEYELDSVDMEWLHSDENMYQVLIKKDTADVEHILALDGFADDSIQDSPYYYVYKIRAKDKQHASKIAMERRSMEIVNES